MDGKSTNRLCRTWYAMKNRCYNPNLPQEIAVHYRDKGITVCCEWKDSFDSFKGWAMNNGYADNLTIDRIDSDGIYCPENCQWLTKSENSKRAAAERERRKTEGHPKNGLWMVVEKIVYMHLNGHTYYGYKVIETGLYKSEALKRVKELKNGRSWETKYQYSPTRNHRIGDIVFEKDLGSFLNAKKLLNTTH